MLLLDEDPITTNKRKKEIINKQKENQLEQELKRLKDMNTSMKNELNKNGIMKAFRFRRLYNIKVKCEMDTETVCHQCLKTYDP